MNRKVALILLCVVSMWSQVTSGQEKQAAEQKAETRKDVTPIRVQVVLAEYDGDKKISSLPYMLPLNAENPRGGKASIRMGLRVPIVVGNQHIQYEDLGTNLDGWAGKLNDGGYDLHLYVERSSAYSPSEQKQNGAAAVEISRQPVIQQFKSEFDLLIHEGQTLQSTLATDPLSGRVTKIEVTVSRVK